MSRLICGDAVEEMRKLPDGSFDTVVTSPPYNLRNTSGGGLATGPKGKWASASLQHGYSAHEDNMPHADYVAWQRECLTEMMRVTSDDGAIFYNHKWRVQKGLIQDRADIVEGFPVRQIIIWRRKGGLNFNDGYFLPTYEVIYLIAKKGFRLAPKACGAGDVWEIAQEMNNPHPAPFPVELVEKILGSTTAKNVLDPFMGSGSTAVAAINLDRDYTGIELSPEYWQQSIQRVAEHEGIV